MVRNGTAKGGNVWTEMEEQKATDHAGKRRILQEEKRTKLNVLLWK